MTAYESAERTPENRVALFFQYIWGVIRRPRSTVETLAQRRPIWEALILILILFVLAGISRWLLTSEASFEAFELNFGLIERLTAMGIYIFMAMLAYIVPLALLSGCCWVMIRILGGDSSYFTLFSTMAFLAVIFVIISIARFALTIISGISELSVQAEYLLALSVSAPVTLALVIWYGVLCVFLVQYASGISTGRAIAAVAVSVGLIVGGLLGVVTAVGLNILSRLS